jgi:hypothetical protein
MTFAILDASLAIRAWALLGRECPLWSLADITTRSRHVRFTPNNGHWSAQVSIWLSVYEYTP